MKITAEPRSDQFNADDLISGARTFTISGVNVGAAEQKYDIALAGEERAWRPPLTVLRMLLAVWGDDSDNWVGQQVTLYRDETVRFGKEQVGGIRVSHVTGISEPASVRLTTARGKRGLLTVQPMPQATPASPVITDTQISEAADIDVLRGWWANATKPQQALIEARVTELGRQADQ